MPGINVIDIEGKQHAGVSIDFANKHLLNRVKALSVFGVVDGDIDDDYDEDEFDRKAGIFFGELNNFLSKNTQRIDTIKIDEIQDGIDQIPEYLTFLASSLTSADCLDGKDCFWGEGPLACFMAGLCHWNGPKKFSVSSISDDALEMLSLGIGASPSLEHLEIAHMNTSTINALRYNQNVKSLSVKIPNGFCHSTVLQTALEHSKLQTLKMKLSNASSVDDTVHGHCWEILQNGISLPDSILKEIRLDGFSFPDQHAAVSTQVEEMTLMTNASVESLGLVNTSQPLPTIMGVVRLFKSLVHLDISGGSYSNDDLSALDELLLSSQTVPSLQSLCLSQCQIGAEAMMGFVHKLDRMKKLKVLIAADNPFTQSEACMTALKEALWKNTSLEFVSVGGNLPPAIAEKLNLPPSLVESTITSTPELLSSSEMLPLHLNRAGRGALLVHNNLTGNNLLPQILERAGKLEYYTCGKEDANDFMFGLLRHVMIAQLAQGFSLHSGS